MRDNNLIKELRELELGFHGGLGVPATLQLKLILPLLLVHVDDLSLQVVLYLHGFIESHME